MDREEKDFLLEKIMIEYGNELVRLAFSYVKDAETAKDLVQNTFIKCYKNLDTFQFCFRRINHV
ncbi:sigma-70-like protein [Ureibacillus acetophenoni]|uniref:Sigma-70-like protein n=1 Tax=Ureibacillus acetophenoni TaxID=614649 RepID=A0A285UR32_9BACL|nr:sigma-70-like protein [Ureibacillus acetophenoni]